MPLSVQTVKSLKTYGLSKILLVYHEFISAVKQVFDQLFGVDVGIVDRWGCSIRHK